MQKHFTLHHQWEGSAAIPDQCHHALFESFQEMPAKHSSPLTIKVSTVVESFQKNTNYKEATEIL
jgi:hypothetical protein